MSLLNKFKAVEVNSLSQLDVTDVVYFDILQRKYEEKEFIQ